MRTPGIRDRISSGRVLGFRGRGVPALISLLLALFVVTPAFGQRSDYPSSLRSRIYQAFDAADYDRAIELIEKYLTAIPNDPGMLYNAACAYCQLDEFDTAASYLYKSIKAGFRDYELMRTDPDLKGLKTHPTYQKIFERRDREDGMRSRSALAQWRSTYDSPEYFYETDEKRRIQYATALDPVAHKEMREMLEEEADQLIGSLFSSPPGYFVLIAVPRPEDSNLFFKGRDSIGGIYQHGKRLLVARNIGGSLRHEFFHAYHYGDMERLNQFHHLWIQEGLASLYEEYDIRDDGTIIFLPNERLNITKARASAGRLYRWENIFAMTTDEFMHRASSIYPQVRSMFRYIAEKGKLTDWYQAYTDLFPQDPTGERAFEAVFETSLKEIERDWRKWVAAQPRLDLFVRSGDASLGIRSGRNISNNGVVITDILPGSAARKAGLRRGDVIVSADGSDTRTMAALQKIIGTRKIGDLLTLRVRRNEEYFTLMVKLRPLIGGF